MDLYDWLLFLHVLSAFLVVGALTALWALVLGTRVEAPILSPDSTMRFGRVAGPLVGVGMGGAIVFGIWLAIEVDGYELWDGWILASLVLWVVATCGGRTVREGVHGRSRRRAPAGDPAPGPEHASACSRFSC